MRQIPEEVTGYVDNIKDSKPPAPSKYQSSVLQELNNRYQYQTQEELDVVNEEYSYSPITINKDNIIGLLMSRLVNNQLNSDVITNAQKHLM